MKRKSYEKVQLLYLSIGILIVLECIFFILLDHYKMETYQKVPAIVVDSNTILVSIIKKEKITFYKGNFFYIENQKIKYQIQRENNYIMEKDIYYELTIHLEKEIHKKEKEIVEVTIPKEKEKVIKIFQKIKDGG